MSPLRPCIVLACLVLVGGCQSGAKSRAPDGAAGAGGSAGASGAGGLADDGGAPTDGSFANPVKGSQADTTLVGTDSDANGVRDDVDAYLATLEADSRKHRALISFARESTAMMVLGGTVGTTRAAAVAAAQRVGRTIDCLHDLYVPDLETKRAILQNVRNALYNNAMRLRAYNHASTLLSGSILRAGRGCDSAITGVSP